MGARVDLFDAAAERVAMTSGRSKTQEKVELLHPERAPDWGALWACRCGSDIGPNPLDTCPACGE